MDLRALRAEINAPAGACAAQPRGFPPRPRGERQGSLAAAPLGGRREKEGNGTEAYQRVGGVMADGARIVCRIFGGGER
ncbi:hypothetical protein, partial [Anaerotruncus massiliensis (ex Togo et al. 2019)]|uniref:hypothetical protein n=1 Tax=Anaerotruncus massiliensis (ex Togo et al. 2019) TaxID=1673720 RepID=UPI0023F08BE3